MNRNDEIASERLYWNEDKTKLVPAGHKEAATLACAEGHPIPGDVDIVKSRKKPAANKDSKPEGDKGGNPDANKENNPDGDKGGNPDANKGENSEGNKDN